MHSSFYAAPPGHAAPLALLLPLGMKCRYPWDMLFPFGHAATLWLAVPLVEGLQLGLLIITLTFLKR
jgi:hypothetical protein